MMNPESTQEKWFEANRQYLIASIHAVQYELEAYQHRLNNERTKEKKWWQKFVGWLFFWNENPTSPARKPLQDARKAWPQVDPDLPYSPALESLATIFGLSRFEQKVLVLCAGMELDAKFSALVSQLSSSNPNGAAMRPTFSLALAAFADAHWSAISPQSPLRYWNLLLLNNAELVTRSALKIDEYILHYLTGTRYMDEKLIELLDPVTLEYPLASSQEALATAIAHAVGTSSGKGSSLVPFVLLNGDERSDHVAVAALASRMLGFQLYRISALSLSPNPKDSVDLLRWWNREAALHPCALYLDCSRLEAHDRQQQQAVLSLIDGVQSILLCGGSNGELTLGAKRKRMEFEVPKPLREEQLALWVTALGPMAPAGKDEILVRIVDQFNLSAKNIEATAREARPHLYEGKDAISTGQMLWQMCCVQTRPKLDELAQRITPVATWNDIVLSDEQISTLEEISQQVNNRRKVYRDFGMEKASSRGLGISALFAGESGTGKTMASEVLANDLKLDLYRIDLSQVVNKYIGETEKNLKRIFDAAEEGGVILLFDEADALFGKRSEVKDSHDRYSNIEVSYLLQRMESYKGLAILTTNMKNALDIAFMRRIRFAVNFSYPDARQRQKIWERAFPSEMPKEGIDFKKLSQLNLPGGNIRNVAINAAFLAATEGGPLLMSHIYQAARSEYRKLERTFTQGEIKAMQ